MFMPLHEVLMELGSPEALARKRQALNPEFAERFQDLTRLSVYGLNGKPIPLFGGEWAKLPFPFLIVVGVVGVTSIIGIISAGVKAFNLKG